jgi:hypothetical protein
MSLTLDIEHDNSTSTLEIVGPDSLGDSAAPSLVSADISRSLVRRSDKCDEATVVVYRDAWTDVQSSLDRTDDVFRIKNASGAVEFGGRLRDSQIQSTTVSVELEGPKRDALDAEPSGGNDRFAPQPDSDIVSSILGRVNTVAAGTVNTVSTVAFSESQASPGKSLAKLAAAADAECRYRATGTGFEFDYQASLGADRTATTLSAANQNVIGEPRVREDSTENVTNVRVLGAQSGTAQVVGTAQASSFDPSTDREVFRAHADKDIQQQDRADALASTLVNEYDGSTRYLEVSVDVRPTVDPAIGDDFSVSLPAHNVDQTLRVVELRHIFDSGGERYRLTLSTRRHTRESAGESRAESLRTFEEGNAGQFYSLADGEGWDAVGASTDYEFSFYRPVNTIDELRAKLRLESRPYRLRAEPIGHTHDVTHPSHSHEVTHPSHDHSVTVPDHNHTVSINSTTEAVQTEPKLQETETDRSTFSVTPTTGAESYTLNTFTVSSTLLSWPYELFFSFSVDEQEDVNIKTDFVEFVVQGGGTVGQVRLDPQAINTSTITTQSGSQIPSQYNGFSLVTRDLTDETLEFQISNVEFYDNNGNAIESGSVTVHSEVELSGVNPHTHGISDTETTADGGGTTETSSTALGTNETTTSALGTTESTTSEVALDNGINEQPNEQVSNVAVDIDGQTVASGLSPPIDRTIDIAGVLSDGENPVTITSGSLGELRATVEYEALKNAQN